MNNYTNILKILEGCLLGDGHLELPKRGINASFKYLSSSKEHTEYVHSFFKEYCSDNYQTIKRGEYYDKRTNKTYVHYYFRTKSLPFFTEQQKRFYINRIKIVPKDIDINNNSLLFWFIGDGELESNIGFVKLHTNSFIKKDVEFLCEKLKDFSANLLHKKDDQYLIRIPRNKVKHFLNFIGECPINDYKHKWDFVEYKNKNIEINGVNHYSEIYPLITADFIKDDVTIYELCKKYGVPIKAIKNYFDTNDIKWKPIITKKKICQYNLNGKLIKTWNSGQDIKRELKFNATGISECCRGLRKKYKNFIWKFNN
jgi:hypothetical protein